MKNYKITIRELKSFLLLWLTQSFSTLGSSMTNFALVVWSYEAKGSALTTALLTVCSYAPYVLVSIFAALCTVVVLILLQTGNLEVWHLYVLNAYIF